MERIAYAKHEGMWYKIPFESLPSIYKIIMVQLNIIELYLS